MVSKIKRGVVIFLGVALVVAILRGDWSLFSGALSMLALLWFVAFLGGLFRGGQPVPAGSCSKCRGSGRVVMPGNWMNGTPCSH